METFNITNTINTLSTRRKDWEDDTFKKSNNTLYQLLEDCLKLYIQVKGDTKLCKALNADLTTRGITFNDGASLPTRIVRAVFGKNCGKRAYAYARVISVAAAEKEVNTSLKAFIVERGGIEEIRRKNKNGDSPSDIRNARKKFAEDEFETSPSMVTPFTAQNQKREHKEGATSNLFVAIMREEENGEISMLFDTNTTSVVKSALVEAGKVLKAETEIKPVVDTPKPADGNVRSGTPKYATNAAAVNKYIDKAAAHGGASPS